MDSIFQEFKTTVDKTISYLREDLKTIRTGKASPALLEGLVVTTYGGQTQLRLPELATISTEGPLTLIVSPYDQSTLPDIEKAVLTSNLGLSPATQGTRILITIPPLSQEQREKFIKVVGQKIEEKKNAIRGARDDARRKIKASEENGEISEDERFRKEKEVDEQTQKYMEDIQDLKERKEAEIRQI